jgi:DNA-binding MarR family transcriptional regulator
MDVTPSAITVMLDRLVQSKLVSRYHDEKDRRFVLVRLTQLGHDSLTKVDQIRKENLSLALSSLDVNELKAYVETYEKLAHLYSTTK